MLYTTRWGWLLLAKMVIYVVMVSSAVIVVTVVGPRLRRRFKAVTPPAGGVFGPQALASFDGKEGRPGCIAFRGKVYDAGESALWKDGAHMRLHVCGQDLTDAISRAPHGPERLAGLKAVGSYDASLSASKTPAQKGFYVVAYMNLTLVFVVLFIVAAWRWGL